MAFNKQHPSVTAIIPCWKCKETIDRAVSSVYDQSLRPVKLILVDDASGDGTAEYLDLIALRYPKNWIEVVKLTFNSGPGPARNAGWDISNTDFIAFLDADDAWHPQKIELQFNWMQKNPHASICGHSSNLYDQSSGFKSLMTLEEPKVYGFFEMMISNRMITRTVMLKRRLPFRFRDKNVTEDYLLWLEIAKNNLKLYRFDEPLACSFREEYSVGGYSGNLWKHELRELNAVKFLYKNNKIDMLTFIIFSSWSITKYFRRVLLRYFNTH